MSNDYTELTIKRLNWIKKIKFNQKLPSDLHWISKGRLN